MDVKKWGRGAVSGLVLMGIMATFNPAALANQVVDRPVKVAVEQQKENRLEPLAQFLGTDTQKLIAERKSGKSLVQIAKSRGKSEQELHSFLSGQCRTRIGKLVATGKMTQTEADQKLAKLDKMITAMINDTSPQFGLSCHREGKLSKVAQFLGMDLKSLIAERKNGKSLVQIAKSKGKSEQELHSFLYGQCKTRLDKLVADGKITRDQADQRLKRMESFITKEINATEWKRTRGAVLVKPCIYLDEPQLMKQRS